MVVIRGWGFGGTGEMLSKSKNLKLVDRTSLVVKGPPSDAGDAGLIPGWGTKIPHAISTAREACALQQKRHMPHNKDPAQPKNPQN